MKYTANAPQVLGMIRDLVSDMPDTVPVTDFSTFRWETLKQTDTTVKVDLGNTKLTFKLETKDAE